MAKDAISLFLSVGHFLLKKTLKMLLRLLLQTTPCCASPVSQNTLLGKFGCYFSVSFLRRRSWSRCWHEIWSTSSQWEYQDRRPSIITFTPEGWGADLYHGHKQRGSLCRCSWTSEIHTWPSRVAANLFSVHTVCSTGLVLCLQGATAVQPPFLLFGHLYQYSWREHCLDCEFLSKIM